VSAPLRLPGAVVLITGAARGIGAETARRLHARGASVAVTDADGEAAEALAAELGDRAAPYALDVTDREQLGHTVAQVRERFGGIDCLLANAGIAPPSDTLLTIDEAAFEKTVEVDLLGVWRSIRACLPDLVERRGHVLVVASIYAFLNGALNASYAMSKAGVEALGRALRVELAAHGASAGVAYFGFVDTGMVREAFERPQVALLREALPGWLTRPIPVERAADALVRGIERRAPVVAEPRYVRPALALRGALMALDARLAGDSRLHDAVADAERRRSTGGSGPA
jgi:NAD(P)-dependent dehydrogenase (short-subunit alcohol dehydrogenase family)